MTATSAVPVRAPTVVRVGALTGFFHQVGNVSMPRAFTRRLRERHGDLLVLEQGRQALAFALTAEAARQILSAEPNGFDAFWKEGFSGIAGPGSLWVLDGERHRRERQILTPAFHARHYRAYGEVIRDITRSHLARWRDGQTISAIDTTVSISLDVIMRVVFGVEDGPFKQEGYRVLPVLWRTMHPLIVFLPQLQRPWFPVWRRYVKARDDFTDWVRRCLAARRARPGDTGEVLGSLLAATYDDGTPMSDDDIRDELLTILLAGYVTSATALAWALYELGRHPASLARLRYEVEALGPEPDPAAAVRLPYLSAVCDETLRLHTLLAEIGRVVAAPLDVFGYTLQPGSAILVSIMSIHHDPELYPEPDAFKPERFLERTYSPAEFLPFGGGHRRCIGAGLSDFEMRLALAEIVPRWDFTPTAVEREVRHDIAMGPKYRVPLRITARRQPGRPTNSSRAGESTYA